MARVLFLGCNANQLPYLEAARALGFTVIGTDRNPQAAAAGLADRFHVVGYDDAGGLLRVAREEGFGPDDRIFTASAHIAYEAASSVAAQLGIAFPAPDAVATCLDKTRFYARLGALEIGVPPTRELTAISTPEMAADTVYWLKSDYGKSPRYCWRVVDGVLPPLPPRFDAFYRRAFVLQEEVLGTHYRLNLYGDQAAVFVRGEAHRWRTARELPGSGAGVVPALWRFLDSIGATRWLTKFDLIEREGEWFVLDVGLDPPLRLRLLCEHLGIDFAALYLRAYLTGDPSVLPAWSEMGRPVEISGSAEEGYRVRDLEVAA